MESYFITFPCSPEIYEWVVSAPDHERRPTRYVTIKPSSTWNDDDEHIYFVCATTAWDEHDVEWIVGLINKAMRND